MRFKIYNIGFAILFSTLPLIAQTTNPSDLKWRLEHLNGDSYRQSINHALKNSNTNTKKLPDWEKSLEQLVSQKTVFIDKIDQNDQKTIEKIGKLFRDIDQTMLSLPVISDKQILVLNRNLGERARHAMGAEAGLAPTNFQNNSEIYAPATNWNNEFILYKDINKNKIQKETLYKPEQGMIINDPELHFDGDKLLYSSIGTNNRWHLFELDLKTGTSKQVTPEAYKDFDSFDGCYTPDNKLIFCSTGTFLGLPCTDGDNKMCGLFKYDPQTGKTRQLTFDQDSNWDPVVLDNGKIMYQRWEYADLPHSNSRVMFTMNPDGTEQRA